MRGGRLLSGNRVLRLLVASWLLFTVVGVSLSVWGVTEPQRVAPDLSTPDGWMGVAWLVLVLAVAWRCTAHVQGLRRLVSTRDEEMAAVTATSREWLWEARAAGPDDPGMVFTFCSPSVTTLLGYWPGEMVGRPVQEFLWAEDVARARSVARCVRTNLPDTGGHDDVELRWRHADGHPVWMTGNAVPVLDRGGSVVGFRGARHISPHDRDAEARLAAIRVRVSDLLAQGPLTMALQPIVRLDTGDWVGVEALARFPDDRRPDLWFSEAYEAGLGLDLELAAVTAALDCLTELPENVGLSVNVSPGMILDPRLTALLTAPETPADRLTLELTEHARVSGYDDLHRALAPLRDRGLRLAVDDTGAGYASFSHVLRLRPDTIKLDRSLIGGIDADQARRAFVTAVVLLGLELGAVVTAEGVETPEEYAVLAQLGVGRAQGYLLGRPSTYPERWRAWRSSLSVSRPTSLAAMAARLS